MQKIILASSSPRRKEILEKMGLEFEIIPSDYEEVWENLDFSYEKVEDMAFNKAMAVLKKHHSLLTIHHSLILSADTVVVLDNKILTKPKDKPHALIMLKSLSAKKHSVVTSVCLINLENMCKIVKSETSYVEFNELSQTQIIDYIEKFKPIDKAGAYGIQELPQGFIKSVEGSYENIIGLCPQVVSQLINDIED